MDPQREMAPLRAYVGAAKLVFILLTCPPATDAAELFNKSLHKPLQGISMALALIIYITVHVDSCIALRGSSYLTCG